MSSSGLEVLTTASPRNFDYLKSLGADACFDYNSPTCGADIRKYTNNNLYYVMDCISEASSPQICADALSSDSSGKKPFYGKILGVAKLPREDVEERHTLGYTAMGEAFTKGKMSRPAIPEDYAFATKFMKIGEQLLAEGKLKPHRSEVGSGGLNGVFDGMDRMEEGKVSGRKLVYRVSET
jgi:NADPH:quinone reductase-like Zn-dependent oxidoreductase